MPFNGSGVYTAPAADFPVVTQTVISSTHFNNTINDIATALSTCLTKDGQQTATANIPFGGFRATNVGITAIAGSVGTPAINVSDAATGLYRSAASELAVTVAGTQRARFDGTGLIVTGVGTFSGATSTTTLTASTSVVTPLVGSAGSALNFSVTGLASQWVIDTFPALYPSVDQGSDIGKVANRIRSVFTPIIDSGTTGSLSLKTNNGQIGLTVTNNGAATSQLFAIPGVGGIFLQAGGATNTSFDLITKGTGSFNLRTGSVDDFTGSAVQQFQVLHTASANRNITVTGSNGGNPTLSTTAGSLAITPAVVIAGASLQIGTNPATSANSLAVPYNTVIASRNSANTNDIGLIAAITVNAVTDVSVLGTAATSAGTHIRARTGAAAPTTSDLPASFFTVWRDSGGATTKLYYNNAGAIQSVALA